MEPDPQTTPPPQRPRVDYRSELERYLAKPRQIDHKHQFREPLRHGWLLPYLLKYDDAFNGRWDHWYRTMERGELLDEPIPEIHWCDGGHPAARKMWERTFNAVTKCGEWRGWSAWTNVNYIFDWLLFGLGHQANKELPNEPEDGACSRLYQTFCLEAALGFPHDYFGDMLAENAHGKHNGFYPTPMSVVQMMTMMQFHDEADMRDKSVCDPCLGTGRMLLCAGSHSYCLYGMDIDATVIKAALINGYFYVPWMVRPFPFLDPFKPTPEAAARAEVLQRFGGALRDEDLQPNIAIAPVGNKPAKRKDAEEQPQLTLF